MNAYLQDIWHYGTPRWIHRGKPLPSPRTWVGELLSDIRRWPGWCIFGHRPTGTFVDGMHQGYRKSCARCRKPLRS